MDKLTRQQRRAAERKAAKRAAIYTPPTPYLHKLNSKLRTATLNDLKRLVKKFTRARDRLARELEAWQRETENRIAINEWPDAEKLIQVALCFSMICEAIGKRGAKIQFDERIAELNAIDAELKRQLNKPVSAGSKGNP